MVLLFENMWHHPQSTSTCTNRWTHFTALKMKMFMCLKQWHPASLWAVKHCVNARKCCLLSLTINFVKFYSHHIFFISAMLRLYNRGKVFQKYGSYHYIDLSDWGHYHHHHTKEDRQVNLIFYYSYYLDSRFTESPEITDNLNYHFFNIGVKLNEEGKLMENGNSWTAVIQ